jgi:hypothetical protein
MIIDNKLYDSSMLVELGDYFPQKLPFLLIVVAGALKTVDSNVGQLKMYKSHSLILTLLSNTCSFV